MSTVAGTTSTTSSPTLPETERLVETPSGLPVLVAGIVALLAAIAAGVVGIQMAATGDGLAGGLLIGLGGVVVVAAVVVLVGLFMLEPNKAAVLLLFGDYRGTTRQPGLRWANPLYRKRMVSLRIRNFETADSKVNDAYGNPIQIGAVVVWRVTDTARAVFHVDDFEGYVEIQAESAVRHLARSFPYDSFSDGDDDSDPEITLTGDVDVINDALRTELSERMAGSGVEIIEARLTDLAYAPEIAEAMLRRQQATAVVAARRLIVKGAVDMVRDAVAQLEHGDTDTEPIPMDTDRKATFASNLMTVIASDHPTSPVVNVGTLSR